MMKVLLFILLLTICSQAALLRRLQTVSQSKFAENDTIISTLGYFKMTLLKTNCTIKVQTFNFNNNSYILKGNYTSNNVTNDCNYLQLSNSTLLTHDSKIFLSLPTESQEASFTIDDNGVIQLIAHQLATNDGTIPENNEVNIRNFQTQQKYVKSYSNVTLDQQNSGNVINQNDWIFYLFNGQVVIQKRNISELRVIYPFTKVIIRASGLYDFNNFQMPMAIFRNITYQPRCVQPAGYLDYKAPFTIEADQFWPIIRFYEQGGYIMKQIAVGDDPSFYFPNEQRQITHYKRYSPCPVYTFLYKDQCVSECPPPYFHQIYGNIGKCVLVCEQTAPIDPQQKICSCSLEYERGKFTSNLIANCPVQARQTYFGCVCTQPNFYFDRKVSFSCVTVCPQGTFGRNGICMECSDKCLKCQLDELKIAYLSCQQCDKGYKLYNGKCVQECNRFLGLQLFGGKCQSCNDTNCIDCHVSQNQCLACRAIYALQEKKCVANCSSNYKMVHRQVGQTVCIEKSPLCISMISSNYKTQAFIVCDSCPIGYLGYGQSCVQTCPIGLIPFNNQHCICSDKNQLLIGKTCYNIPACPIKTSYDLKTGSCISCPQGCISCFENQCTSCSPGFILRVTPLYVACFRKNPFTTCQKQYSIQQGVCLVNNFDELSMNLCLNRISNCKVCVKDSNDICILCKENYLLYNNTCISNCPQNTIKYQNTCILPQIQYCQVPHLMTQRVPFIVNLETLLNAPLGYYSYQGDAPFNNPVSYIIIQQNFIQLYDSLTRDSFVTEVTWGCLKCIKGYGLNSEGKCVPCPSNCIDCYLARADACFIENQTQISCPFKQKSTGNCRQSCSSEQQIPSLQNGTLFCIPISQSNIKTVAQIDGAVYTFPNQQKIVYFVLSDQVNEKIAVQVVQKTILTPSQELQLIQSARSLQSIGTTSLSKRDIQDGSYILIDQSFKEAFILNLTNSVSQIQTKNGQFLPNAIYGVTDIQSHPEFMKLWLAYIGYVLSIVVIILHVIFIGNDLLYKVDNLLIFIQTLYYFSFVKLLVGKLLAQYYYGWIYSHGGFFPNYFQSLSPNGYFQQSAPDSYKLATLDANFFRNGGFSLSFFIAYIAVALIVIFLVYVISKLFQKPQIWYYEIAKNSILAGIEFFSMNIFYWAVANLMYNGGGEQINKSYHSTNITVSAIMIALILLYTSFRLYFHFLGGIYMIKRLAIAVILAAAAVNKIVFIVPLLILECLFLLLRWKKQQPENMWQYIFLIGQQIFIFGLYFLLFFSINAGVNTIILSIFIFIFIVILFVNLSDVYLESQQEYFEQEKDYDENVKYNAPDPVNKTH